MSKKQRIQFCGIPEGQHTWFPTRTSEEGGKVIGGDIVSFVKNGATFDLDYMDQRHAESFIKRGLAKIVGKDESATEEKKIEPDKTDSK